MRLKGIRFENVPYKISGVPRVLLPGQSAAVRLTPTGETHGKYGKIMIDYNEIPNIKFSKTRAECVTVL